MAFDRTNPADLLALKNEQATDPIGMGYAAVDGQTQKTLDLFNVPDLNVKSPRPTTGQRLTVSILLDIPELAVDLDHNQVSEGDKIFITSFMNRDFDADIERWRAQITEALRSQSDTVTALNALIRDMSRAEVLFGVETVISKQDWIAARDS